MAKTIKITLNDEQVKILEHELLDIEQWVKDAVEGRINYTTNVLVDEAKRVLDTDPDVDAIPKDPAAVIALYRSHPAYRNRRQRAADEDAERLVRQAEADEAAAKQQADAERAIQDRIDTAVTKALKAAKKA